MPISPPSSQPIDVRRDEFRKYLERTGVLDMFTKVLSKLMTEADKPENAIDFIRENLGDSLNDKDTILSLTQKLEEANVLIEELRTKLRQYEPMEVLAETEPVASVPEVVAAIDATPSPAAAAPIATSPAAETVEVVQPMQVDTTPKEPETVPPAAVPTPAVVVAPEAAPSKDAHETAALTAPVPPAEAPQQPSETPDLAAAESVTPAVVPPAEASPASGETPAETVETPAETVEPTATKPDEKMET